MKFGPVEVQYMFFQLRSHPHQYCLYFCPKGQKYKIYFSNITKNPDIWIFIKINVKIMIISMIENDKLE